jgi:hypothetical protein
MIDKFYAVARAAAKHDVRDAIKSLRIGPEEEAALLLECGGDSRTWFGYDERNMPRTCVGLPFNVDYRFKGVEVEYLEGDSGRNALVTKACEEIGIPCRAI